MKEFIDLIFHENFCEVILNRSKSLNALNLQLLKELTEILINISSDPSIRGVLLSGRGRAFCAGGDLKWALEYSKDPGISMYVLAGQLNRAVLEIRNMGKPVVALINGSAAGAGFTLALACDFRIMERSAFFQLAYTTNGLCIDGGGTFNLARLVGIARAMEMVAFDERISSDKALEWGLVNQVVEDGSGRDTTIKMLQRLAERSLHAFSCCKELLNQAFKNDFERQIELERLKITECARHGDGQEGLRAFVEKRPPRFVSP